MSGRTTATFLLLRLQRPVAVLAVLLMLLTVCHTTVSWCPVGLAAAATVEEAEGAEPAKTSFHPERRGQLRDSGSTAAPHVTRLALTSRHFAVPRPNPLRPGAPAPHIPLRC